METDLEEIMWSDPPEYPQCSDDLECKTLNKFLSTPEELLEAEKFILSSGFSEYTIEDFLSTGVTEPEIVEDSKKYLLQFKKDRRWQLLTLLRALTEELNVLEEDINELEK